MFNVPLILVFHHVDEINDDQATEVADPQLAGNLVRCLEVGVERGFLDITALGGARRVDVYRGQRLGVIDDDSAAGGQGDLAGKSRFDLVLDLETVEQRQLIIKFL